MKQEYIKRRRKLLRDIGKNSIAILPTATEKTRNRDSHYPFRADSDFQYLTGFNEPDAIAVFIPNRKPAQFILFCRERDPKMELWNGYRAGLQGAIDEYGADDAFPIDDIGDILPGLLENRSRIFYDIGAHEHFDQQLISWINQLNQHGRAGIETPQTFIALSTLLHEMRLIKSPAEIKCMRKAAKISAKAHCSAMQTCQPGMKEYEVEAELLYVFKQHGCQTAYNSIVGSGKNGCILHYTENNAVLNNGDLLLIDAGAELDGYASDITRTFPVNGQFSTEQAAIYNIVLKAQLAAIQRIKPGVTWDTPHNTAIACITEGLIKLGLLKGNKNKLIHDKAYNKFYMHRTGHWLGLDVHDVGRYKINNKWRRFEPGQVLTVEPGIYIQSNNKSVAKKWWNIGIRIEDDILVTATGHEVLSKDVPKTIADIESLMS